LYSDIEIDDEWVVNAETDDSDLFSSLINQPIPDLEVPIVQTTIPIDVFTHEDNPEMPMDVDTSISCSEPSGTSMGASQSPCNDNESTSYLLLATHDLERYAADNHFSIHHVAGDDNCLYNAVLYQLQSNGVLNVTVQNLREMVATYLSQHAETYMPFVCSPVSLVLPLITLMTSLPP